MQNVKTSTNELTGTVSVSKKKALVFALPYSKGFTAYVDGEEVPIVKANTMYMAVELDKGTHEIRLVYCTPYLKAGLGLTAGGFLIYIFLVLFHRKKRG